MRMEKKLTSKQLVIVVLGPIGVLAVSWLLYNWLGQVALILPPVLIGILLAYLVVESRNYHLGLFVRSLEESRAQYSQVESILGLTLAIDPLVPLLPRGVGCFAGSVACSIWSCAGGTTAGGG